MMNFVIGCVFGWFAHLHYGEYGVTTWQHIVDGITRVTGG